MEERLVAQMRESPKTLMWVKGRNGVRGDEEADRRAGIEVAMGRKMQKTVVDTPGGIKQEFPIYTKAPAHLQWSRMAVKGLVYMVTDKGPQRRRR